MSMAGRNPSRPPDDAVGRDHSIFGNTPDYN